MKKVITCIPLPRDNHCDLLPQSSQQRIRSGFNENRKNERHFTESYIFARSRMEITRQVRVEWSVYQIKQRTELHPLLSLGPEVSCLNPRELFRR